MANKQFALVLFDHDGCTGIINTKIHPKISFGMAEKPIIRWGGSRHKVEVLNVSDLWSDLDHYEDEWSHSHRSQALHKEKKRRIANRSTKFGGYLAVWPTEDDGPTAMDSAEVENAPTNKPTSEDAAVTKKVQNTTAATKKATSSSASPTSKTLTTGSTAARIKKAEVHVSEKGTTNDETKEVKNSTAPRKNYLYALILFDHDGLTDVIDTSTYTDIFAVADKPTVKWHGRQYLAEILCLSDSKSEVDIAEGDWVLTHRYQAIEKERERTKKAGGYLSVWPSDDEVGTSNQRGTGSTTSTNRGAPATANQRGTCSTTSNRGAPATANQRGTGSTTSNRGAAANHKEVGTSNQRGTGSTTSTNRGAPATANQRGTSSTTSNRGAPATANQRGTGSKTSNRGAAANHKEVGTSNQRGTGSTTSNRGAPATANQRGTSSTTSNRGAPATANQRGTGSTTSNRGAAANHKEGLKGRKIAVLHEGSGDYGINIAKPNRKPVYMDDLTVDQAELINLQMEQHAAGMKNIATQTDKVVTVGDKNELKKAVFVPSEEKSTQTEECPPSAIQILTNKVDEVLQLVGLIASPNMLDGSLLQNILAGQLTLSTLTTPAANRDITDAPTPSTSRAESTPVRPTDSYELKLPSMFAESEIFQTLGEAVDNSDQSDELPAAYKLRAASRTSSFRLAQELAVVDDTLGQQPTVDDETPAQQQTVVTQQPTVVVQQPTVVALQPTVVETPAQQQTVVAQQPMVVPQQQTVVPQQPTVVVQQPTVVDETPAQQQMVAQQPTAVTQQQTVVVAQQPTVVAQQHTVDETLAQQQVVVAKQPTVDDETPAQQQTVVAQQPTMAAQQPTVVAQQPTVDETLAQQQAVLAQQQAFINLIQQQAVVKQHAVFNLPQQQVVVAQQNDDVEYQLFKLVADNSVDDTTHDINEIVSLPVVENEKDRPSFARIDKRVSAMRCNSGPLVEITSAAEMRNIPRDAEVRIVPMVAKHLRSKAVSKGNFAWTIARTVFTDNELVGRNYFGNISGKQALSPRRAHAIEHAVEDMYERSNECMKVMVTAINTGIRNLSKKSKSAISKQLPLSTIEDNGQMYIAKHIN